MNLRITLKGDWARARRVLGMDRQLREAIDLAVRLEAHHNRAEIVRGVHAQAPAGRAFKKLSPLTLAVRKFQGFKGTKALIRTATLVNSITVTKMGAARYHVGILRTARRRGSRGKFGRGPSLYNLAKIHEEGRTYAVRVTPKMRAFLMMALKESGAPRKRGGGGGGFKRGIIIIRIPARPFISPVLDRVTRRPGELRARLARRIAARMAGQLGKP